jgi:hypothetical protein
MVDEPKPEVSQLETSIVEHHRKHHTIEELAQNEDEPQTPYQLGWRTILCVITLSMGNVCAALANTVSNQSQHSYSKLIFLDQYNHQVPSCDSSKIPSRCCSCVMDCEWKFPHRLGCWAYFCKLCRMYTKQQTLISSGISW